MNPDERISASAGKGLPLADRNSHSAVCFGEFELDRAAYALRRGRQPVRLERRPMDLLILLIDRHHQLVSRAEIAERLWGKDVFVDVEMGVNTAIRKVRRALRDSPDSPSYVETVSGKGYRFIARVTTHAAPASQHAAAHPQPRIMLAVLPFQNLSQDPGQEYFSDGLTEETISYLARLIPERLAVIARTTSMAYKRTSKTVRQIGAELGVDYLLESSVRREGNRVRITSQLIRVKDQTHVWASTYDRDLSAVLAVQRELSTAIARSVRVHLSRKRLAALGHRQTSNAEAYDLYLRGRYFWNQLSPLSTRQAMEFYGRATQLDPDYALAWSGIADAYSASPINGDVPPLRVLAPARDASARAISSAPDSPEAQTSLGFFKFWLDWDWTAAETAFRRSIMLDPSYSLAHRLLGIVLSHLGRREEAADSIRSARELDPLSSPNQALSAQVAFVARDYSGAVRFSQQAVAVDPEFWIGHLQLAQAYERLDKLDLALEALNNAARFSGGNSKAVSLRGYIFAKQGKRKETHNILATLEAVSSERYVPPYATALVYAGLGERESALTWLERAYDVHDVHLVFPPVDPKWDPFRDDSRFGGVLSRCNFSRSV